MRVRIIIPFELIIEDDIRLYAPHGEYLFIQNKEDTFNKFFNVAIDKAIEAKRAMIHYNKAKEENDTSI